MESTAANAELNARSALPDLHSRLKERRREEERCASAEHATRKQKRERGRSESEVNAAGTREEVAGVSRSCGREGRRRVAHAQCECGRRRGTRPDYKMLRI